MLLVGLGFLVAWLLYAVFVVVLSHALLATAIIFIVLGIILGERPWKSQ